LEGLTVIANEDLFPHFMETGKILFIAHPVISLLCLP